MLIFGNDKHARGCYTEMMLRESGVSSGVYITVGDDPFPYPDDPNTPFLVTSLAFDQKEKYNIVQCFNERNYTYAFGHDPVASSMQVTLTSFLAENKGTVFGAGLNSAVGAYRHGRLSAYKEYVVMTLGRLTMQGFLVGISSTSQDQEHNLQSITYSVLLVEPQKGESSHG